MLARKGNEVVQMETPPVLGGDETGMQVLRLLLGTSVYRREEKQTVFFCGEDESIAGLLRRHGRSAERREMHRSPTSGNTVV